MDLSQLTPEQRQAVMMQAQQEANQRIMSDVSDSIVGFSHAVSVVPKFALLYQTSSPSLTKNDLILFLFSSLLEFLDAATNVKDMLHQMCWNFGMLIPFRLRPKPLEVNIVRPNSHERSFSLFLPL